MTDALAPCPFCGGIGVEKWADGGAAINWIQCSDCGAKGPHSGRIGHDGSGARNWNDRAALDAALGAAAMREKAAAQCEADKRYWFGESAEAEGADHSGICDAKATACKQLADAIRAIPTSAQLLAVAVKPLMWMGLDGIPGLAALGIGGHYSVRAYMGDFAMWTPFKLEVVSKHETEEEAKAAAQADHDTRIRDALETK